MRVFKRAFSESGWVSDVFNFLGVYSGDTSKLLVIQTRLRFQDHGNEQVGVSCPTTWGYPNSSDAYATVM